MININNLTIKLKQQTILDNISLTITKGKCTGFVGVNGSGKTVILKSICGFLPISQGEITIDGSPIIPGKKFIKNAGILIEQPSMIPYLSGYENLKFLAKLTQNDSQAHLENILKKVGLFENRKKKYKHYSLGMKQRLRIAQTLIEENQIYILDEPFNGLDKQGIQEMISLFQKLKQQGKTILLTSHDEKQINQLCDIIYEVEGGSISCIQNSVI